MAYTKTTWVNNDAPYLNATNLNKIEDGIFNNDAVLNNKADTTYVDSENTAQDNAIDLKLDADNPTFTGNLTGQYALFDSVFLNTWTVDGAELGNFTIGRQGSTGKVQIQPNAPLLNLSDSNGLQWDGKIVAIAEETEPSLGNPSTNGYVLASQTDGSRYWVEVGAAGTASWGAIGGTLSDQTDLQNELDGKLSTASPTFTGDLTGPNGYFTGLVKIGQSFEFDPVSNISLRLVNTDTSDNLISIDASSKLLELTNDKLVWDSTNVVVEDAYATDTTGGTIKIAVVGTDCYITTDGSTPGA